jgi:hypothetical protein
MITRDYVIHNLFVQNTETDTDIIRSVKCTMVVSDGAESFELNYDIKLDDPSGTIIPFSELTKDQIVEWLEEKIFTGPNTLERFEVEAAERFAEKPIRSKSLEGVTG